jgi:DNA-binding NarL/FixJ family response regulator
LIKIKVPTWFASDKNLPKQTLLRKWKKVSTTGNTVRGPGFRIGETHHNAKLTDHDVELIRLLREGGMKIKEIARKFECSPSNISEITNYRHRVNVGIAVRKVFE